MELSVSKLGAVIMGLTSFFFISSLTILDGFWLWLPFGLGWFAPIYLFVIKFHAYLLSVGFVLFSTKWTSNYKFLIVLGILFFIFLKLIWI